MYISLFSFVLLFCLTCDSVNHTIPSTTVQNHSNSTVSPIKVTTDTFNINLQYVMGQFDPASHPDFDIIPVKYCDNEIRYLRKDALKAFIQMADSAKKDNISLRIVSATRNFDRQKTIWENKWNGTTLIGGTVNAATTYKNPKDRALKILEYSSMPSSSRHHWGTDIDINSVELAYFKTESGKKVHNWLTNNAHKYGYCQTYTPFDSIRKQGYFEEKWHWTYVPVSSIITDYVRNNVKNEMISGFLGSETASMIDVVNNYMLSINPECR